MPRITAADFAELYELFGHATAEDRLWQLEFLKRDARGTLAELHADFLDADINRRLLGYTETELRASYESLAPRTRAIIQAYVDGINRRIDEVMADPEALLPYEFRQLRIVPSRWTVTDQLAATSALYRRFGTNGGQELHNLATLQGLVKAYGEDAAAGMFDDLLWANDPEAHVNIDTEGESNPNQARTTQPDAAAAARRAALLDPVADLAGQHRRALLASEALGVPLLYQRASFFFVVAGHLTGSGSPILSGNPQPGRQPVPGIFYEVHLEGPDGFGVVGVAVPGQPAVIIGRNRDLAWSTNVGAGDNVDLYMETLNPDNHEQYLHNGEFVDFGKRSEVFKVAGREPVKRTIYRSVHGPVVAPMPFDPAQPGNGQVYSWKFAHWLIDTTITEAQLAQSEARNVREFDATMDGIYAAFHYVYADRHGDIAYWAAGRVPLRPAGSDFRLPLDGSGDQEWTGEFRALPKAINPARGYVTGWNTKPSPQFPSADSQAFGPFHRSRWVDRFLERALAGGKPFTMDSAKELLLEMGRVGQGVEHSNAGFAIGQLLPFLERALRTIPPDDPDSGHLHEVFDRFSRWDGLAMQDVLASSTLVAEQVLFDAWLIRLLAATFGDEFGSVRPFEAYSDQHFNMLLHALSGPASALPPSRDYFDDVTTSGTVETVDQVMIRSLRAAIDDLGESFGTPVIAEWKSARPGTPVLHLGPPGPSQVGVFPGFNTGFYSFITELAPPGHGGVILSRLPYGQSGFIGTDAAGKPDYSHPHYLDRLDSWRGFEYHLTHLENPP